MDKFFFTAKAQDNVPEILVYGLIGEEAMASDFVRELKALEKDHKQIRVRINSNGGSILEGLAMYNAMTRSTATIDVYIDGVAASMAAVMAMAGRKVYMSRYSRLMTHSGKGALNGNADHLRQAAALLDSLDNTMCAIYSAKTGKTPEQCKTDYVSREEDKWFTPEQALAEGLVDEIFDTDPIQVPGNLKAANELWNFYNEMRFAAVFNSAKTQKDNMELKLSADNKAALGIANEATEEAINTIIGNLVAKAGTADTLKAQNDQLADEVKNLKKAQTEKEVDGLLATAKAEKKVTDALIVKLKADYAENPTGLKAVLDVMPVMQSVVAQLNTDKADEALKAMLAKSYAELDRSGELPQLKAANLEVFKAKYKEHFGIEYAGN